MSKTIDTPIKSLDSIHENLSRVLSTKFGLEISYKINKQKRPKNENIGSINITIHKRVSGEPTSCIGYAEVGSMSGEVEMISTIGNQISVIHINDILVYKKYARQGIFKNFILSLKDVFDIVIVNNIINPVVKKVLSNNSFSVLSDTESSELRMVWKRGGCLSEVKSDTKLAKDVLEKEKRKHIEKMNTRKLMIKNNPIDILLWCINKEYTDIDFSNVDIWFSSYEDDDMLIDKSVTPNNPTDKPICVCGYTYIPDNKDEHVRIVINADIPLMAIIETLSHEVAHYIDKVQNPDIDDDHGVSWNNIFNRINEIYNEA